jgi:hypothetical protein
MSKGDNLIGIKTTYNGIEFKSKLEAKIALFLDALKIKWEYEPKVFALSNGVIYIPDFFLSELNTWLEVKGDIQEHNKEISRIFVENNKSELILISNKNAFWFSGRDEAGIEDDVVLVGECSNCKSIFFCSNLGSYYCRKCKIHEGDHDIKYCLQSEFFYGQEIINFYDSDSIKEGLKKYGIRI